MFCQNCAAEIPEGASTCPSCGAEVPGTSIAVSGQTDQYSAAYDYESKSSKKADKNTKKILNAEFKNAKAAYKKARKAAGKSRAPLVIFLIILGLALVGAGAFGSYYLMNQKVVSLNARIAELETSLDKAKADAEQAAADAAAQAAVEYSAVEGTWNNVTFESSKVNGTAESTCKAGEQNTPSVSVLMKSFDGAEATANLTVLFHSHEGQAAASPSASASAAPSAGAGAGTGAGAGATAASPQASPTANSGAAAVVAAANDDKVRTFVDVVGTVENGVITFTIDGDMADAAGVPLGTGSKIVVTCELNPTLSSIKMAVKSYFNSTVGYVEDTYTVTKQD